ncbi:prolyl-tRNA synthetase [Candidatus Parcubacteria bacterium]|nr:prolyl-tRNA synthetase [Candidatus Parcubacteria bacterium]
MLQSQLFAKTTKQAPKDEKSVNAQFLIRAGFVDKLAAGIYTYLPFGLCVFKKIEKIIEEEIEAIGGQRILMPCLHPRDKWETTGRWQVSEMFKLKGRSEKEYGLGWTHEEIITPLLKKFIFSYKELPCYVYQIQTKFRDEPRAKSGLLRGREFIMKDLYSFHSEQKDLDNYYEKVKNAYFKIFKRCGIGDETYLTLASGGTFSKYSHEFQTITDAGEDIIYICENCGLAINKEIKQEHSKCPECGKAKFRQEKAIEVGNIFKLGIKYSEPFNFKFKDKNGQEKLVVMGCYGAGLDRLMGAVVEVHNDKQGITWPKEIAPCQVHLIQIEDNQKLNKVAGKLYKDLKKNNIEVLYDERKDKSPGEKFAEADLIGIPYRIVVSERTIKKNSIEIKERKEKQSKLVKIKDLPQFLNEKLKTKNKKRQRKI